MATAHFKGFKRFTDTQIVGIPATARLVVLAGPNGSGKSSIFDGFRAWHGYSGGVGYGWDETYGTKVGTPAVSWPEHASMTFHDPLPTGPEELKRMVYIRSAFRNEADFQVNNFSRLASPLDNPRINRLIDNDVSVSDNYQRLIMQTIDGIYDTSIPDTTTKGEIRDRIIGDVRRAMQEVFPDLLLSGVGGVGVSTGSAGTFYFEKGDSKNFLYKNLSAGEKSAFDLILDTVVKREFYDDTLWCIDEPETHLNTRVQGALLETLVNLLPERCQLFMASHSIGFMRRAWEMAQSDPGSVCFIDLQGSDFDQPVVLPPVQPTRDFWARTLDVALGDLAILVAPEEVVLCEGRPAKGQNDQKAAFDATCYRRIFSGEFPNTDFLSVGNSQDAGQDRIELGKAIQAISSGTSVRRLIDRDTRSAEEVRLLVDSGVRVLSRRHIEAYLLDDDVIRALCEVNQQPERIAEALTIKEEELAASVARGNDTDDWKSPAGSIYVRLRKLLLLTAAGSDWNAFARDTLAPLLQPGMAAYAELRRDVFGR
ncbi:AAA family ATPase [Trujillonella endophytica]|uniref:AAA family ATPase n=1 Tax=Trujillonella endophytica TaxID=673521 RepID=UPI00147E70A6|nr:AAA family ATPase [Trujillella endophytica]